MVRSGARPAPHKIISSLFSMRYVWQDQDLRSVADSDNVVAAFEYHMAKLPLRYFLLS